MRTLVFYLSPNYVIKISWKLCEKNLQKRMNLISSIKSHFIFTDFLQIFVSFIEFQS